MVVYSSGAGVVTKVRNININASFHPIAMHVYVVLRIGVDAPVCIIKVCFTYQDEFWRPFDANGCNNVEYPEEAEAAETRL